MGNKLALAALVVALVALVLHAFELASPGERVARGAPPPDAGGGALEARIAALEAESAELRRAAAANALQPAAVPVDREPASSEADAPQARIEELEARLARLESAQAAGGGRDGSEEGPAHAGRLDTIEQAVQRARDHGTTESARLQGLRALRGQRLDDGTDARLLVLDDMLELARTSQDGGVRADVWRQLSGVTDRRLLQPLLDAVAFDRNVKAREEAVETLSDFLPDPAAHAALLHAAANDPDEGVREDARDYLDGR